MPHFSFWSWPLPFIGTLDEALTKITQVEKVTPWEKKIDKVVWRGTVWFNSISNTALRPHLLAATKGKDWADVASLEWESNSEGAKNSIRIDDFCKYKYIIYTEVGASFLASSHILTDTGYNLLRPTAVPPGLQVNNSHTSTKLPHAHDTLHETSLLLLVALFSIRKFENRNQPESSVAESVQSVPS